METPKMETKENPFQSIDRKSPEIMEALVNAPIYKKQGRVEARPADYRPECHATRVARDRLSQSFWRCSTPVGAGPRPCTGRSVAYAHLRWKR